MTERYADRIENSHEVAGILSKDIFELNSSFRSTAALQIDSQDELLKKLEVVMKQVSQDREINSVKIADLKSFLDRNIAIMKNNWDDKRAVEVQVGESALGKKLHVRAVAEPGSIWRVAEEYIESNPAIREALEKSVTFDPWVSASDKVRDA